MSQLPLFKLTLRFAIFKVPPGLISMNITARYFSFYNLGTLGLFQKNKIHKLMLKTKTK